MKNIHILLVLFCVLILAPYSASASVQAFRPMSSATIKVQGIFASALSTAGTTKTTGGGVVIPAASMSSGKVYMPEASIDGIGYTSQFNKIPVTVSVSGVDTADAVLLSTSSVFSGFPGFYPAVSNTGITYQLHTTPRLTAPNVLYLPRSNNGNQVRYVLTGYTGSSAIGSGSASAGMLTSVTPPSALTAAATITWNYRKDVRASVTSTVGGVTTIPYVDVTGNVAKGSFIVTNVSSTAGLQSGMLVYGNGIPSGTTVLGVDSVNRTITLSSAALYTIIGKALTFDSAVTPGVNFCLLGTCTITVPAIQLYNTEYYGVQQPVLPPAGATFGPSTSPNPAQYVIQQTSQQEPWVYGVTYTRNSDVSPVSTSFADTRASYQSTPTIFTIFNKSLVPMTVTSIGFTGANPGEFAASAATCASLTPTIAAGGYCSINVSFTPASTGAKTATLLVTGSVAFSPAVTTTSSATVSGTGLENVPPTVSITMPVNNSSFVKELDTGITGTASDTGSGVSKVEFSIKKNETGNCYYPSGDLIYPTNCNDARAWITAESTTSWSTWNAPILFSTFDKGYGTYTISARATDGYGNVSNLATAVFQVPTSLYTESTLTMNLPVLLINPGSSLSGVSGKLQRYCPPSTNCNMINLIGRTITITVMKDGTEVFTVSTDTTSSDGSYTSPAIGPFTDSGIYTIQASYAGAQDLSAIQTSVSVEVGKPAGYAVIIEGKIAGDTEGLKSHSKSARRIYKTLKDRKFTDENIYWFNQEAVLDPVTRLELPVDDATPTAAEIGGIISGTSVYANGKTLADMMKTNPAPLYIIMVDHGSIGQFHLGNEVITPESLAGWLHTLDDALIGSTAAEEKKIVVIGACYSGSFINNTGDAATQLPALGRIVITSASAGEQSYQGGNDGQDAVRSGEYFLDEFFGSLKRFATIRAAFSEAAEKTWAYTRQGAILTANSATPAANAMQHPLLDDNGDGVGSIYPSDATGGDGSISSGIYLGAAPGVNSIADPADLQQVADTIYLGSAETTLPVGKPLWAKALNNSEVSSVWVELVRPSLMLGTSNSSAQLARPISSQDIVPLTKNDTTQRYEYSGFSFPSLNGGYGKFEAYYYAIDIQSGSPSPSKRSIIYKDSPYNLNAPTAVDLIQPDVEGKVSNMENPSAQVVPGTSIFFQWSPGSDPDGDAITYRLEICPDSGFDITKNNCIVRDELTDPASLITADSGLVPGATYYWRVFTVDAYGKTTQSTTTRAFTPQATNPAFPVMLKVVVYGNDGTLSGTPLSGAAVKLGSNSELTTITGGACVTSAPANTYSLTVSMNGYLPQTFSVTLVSGVIVVNVYLVPGNPVLQVSTEGSGSGTVNCKKTIGNQSVICNSTFSLNDSVTLNATPDWKSQPVVWGGHCSGSTAPDCVLTMSADRSVIATFNPNNMARVGTATDYATLQGAYDSELTLSGDTIKAITGYIFYENLLLNRSKTVTIDGGYSALDGTSSGGSAIVQGTGGRTLVIQNGKLNVKGLKVR